MHRALCVTRARIPEEGTIYSAGKDQASSLIPIRVCVAGGAHGFAQTIVLPNTWEVGHETLD